jgi:mRNA-degrading endonuclease toxin of MazEF toxin-antitoxin module
MTTQAARRAYARTVLAPRTSLGSRISQAVVTAEHVHCLAGAALRQRLNEVAAADGTTPTT